MMKKGLSLTDRVFWAAVVLLSVAFFLLLSRNIDRLSLWMDEGFHYLAAQGILDHGYPLFPSGHVYYKAILYTYVLAFCSLLFGLNAATLRLVSVVAVAASLPMFYALAKKLFNRWVGLAGVLLLALSPWVVENGRLALYFAPLMLFGLLSVHFFVKGYFEDHAPSKVLAAVFFVLTPQVHQLGEVVIFCFVGLLFIKGVKRFFKKDVLIPLAVVGVYFILIQLWEYFVWDVGYVYAKTDMSLKGMIGYFFSSFSLGYFKEFFKSFPHMSLLVFGGFFFALALRLAGGREDRPDVRAVSTWNFLNLCFVFPLLFLGFFRTHVQPRYLFELYWLFVLLFVASLFYAARALVEFAVPPLLPRLKERARAALALGLFGLGLWTLTDNLGWGRTAAILNRRYNDPVATDTITRSGRFEHYDHQAVGGYVKHFLKGDDIVIAMHMVLQKVYVGRVDYWLWSGGPGTWDAWEKTKDGWKDFHVGARWLNTLPDFQDVIASNPGRRVWLIVSPSLYRRDHINAPIHDFIIGHADKLVFQGRDGLSRVYLWNESPPVLTAGGPTLEGEWLSTDRGVIVFRHDLSKGCALHWLKAQVRDRFTYDLDQALPAGAYRMTWKAAVDELGSSDSLLTLTVSDARGNRLRTLTLTGSSFDAAGRFEELTTPLYLKEETRLKIRGVFTGRSGLWLDACDIHPSTEAR